MTTRTLNSLNNLPLFNTLGTNSNLKRLQHFHSLLNIKSNYLTENRHYPVRMKSVLDVESVLLVPHDVLQGGLLLVMVDL